MLQLFWKFSRWFLIISSTLVVGLVFILFVGIASKQAQASASIKVSDIGQTLFEVDSSKVSEGVIKVVDIQNQLTSIQQNLWKNYTIQEFTSESLLGCDLPLSVITNHLALNIQQEKTKEQNSSSAIDRAFIACSLSRKFDKYALGSVWLHKAYFGGGIYGISNAAQEKFGVGVDNLTNLQAAILVVILKSPNRYRNSDEKLFEQAEYVLEQIENRDN